MTIRSIMRPGRLLLAMALAVTASAVALVPIPASAGPRCVDTSPATIRIGVFGANLTTLVAEVEGYVADQNLDVSYLPVTSSTQQFQSLRDGDYDLILTAPDNVANYRLNDSNALGGAFDVQAVAGMSYGQNLSLMAAPHIEAIADLRGRDIAVDSPSSGFAFVLYEMLRQHGLERGIDYDVEPLGGNFQRFQALLNGETEATLLTGGFELRAANEGFVTLRSVQDAVTPYLGSVLAGRESWARDNCAVVARLIRAYGMANSWILDPANRDDAIELLVAEGATPTAAEGTYTVTTTPGVGIIGNLKADRAALLAVLNLRQAYGGFDQEQNLRRLVTPAGGLYDDSYRRWARHPALAG